MIVLLGYKVGLRSEGLLTTGEKFTDSDGDTDTAPQRQTTMFQQALHCEWQCRQLQEFVNRVEKCSDRFGFLESAHTNRRVICT